MYRNIPRSAFVILVALIVFPVSMRAQELRLKEKTSSGDGWHPWYEIKADPESKNNLIICGTKWDAAKNAPFGFVYASSDEGATWHSVLEDRNSAWVTEQSCAYGPHHRAYFISEASKVIDGINQHKLGTTRLFVSSDSGWHWTETIKTGWADYSSSAVSSASGRLYTFFNDYGPTMREQSGNWRGSVGLLVFSSDGKKVAGPFFNLAMQRLGYHGIFPSSAIALKSGTVVTLYYGKRLTSVGWGADLGIMRADPSPEPVLESTVISHPIMNWTKGCFNYSDNSLAYDPEDNRLFLVYVDGCTDTKQVLLTSSADEGRTWTKSLAVSDSRHLQAGLYNPSLVVGASGVLGLLWEEGEERRSGRWLFSYIRDLCLVEPPTELSAGSETLEVNNDSLRNAIAQAPRVDLENPLDSSLITLGVLNELNTVWRGRGLVAMGAKLIAVWPSENREGQHLYSGILAPSGANSNGENLSDTKDTNETDVTKQTVILYAGTQHFDSATGILKICVAVANRGHAAIRVPIKLEAKDIKSSFGPISIINASNRLPGSGAQWIISDSVTGDELPPGAASNPFCLSFRIDLLQKVVSPPQGNDLLILRVKVLTTSGSLYKPGHKR